MLDDRADALDQVDGDAPRTGDMMSAKRTAASTS
jgi:hypothetical protein